MLIDSYHDKRTAYEFSVNPAGVKADRYWFNDNNSDEGWDAVWDVKVSRDANGITRRSIRPQTGPVNAATADREPAARPQQPAN